MHPDKTVLAAQFIWQWQGNKKLLLANYEKNLFGRIHGFHANIIFLK
jgi:hypothetical protein